MNKELANRITERVLSEQIAPNMRRVDFDQPKAVIQADPFSLLSRDEYIEKYGKEQYYKKLNKLTTRIAQQIYNSKQSWESWAGALLKGTTLGDQPDSALKAIRQIRNARHFEQVQSKFKELSGGAGIGQWIASYLGYKWSAFQNIEGTDWNPEQTIKYGNAIINHLKKIGADPETIDAINTRVTDSKFSIEYGGDAYKTSTEIISGEFFKKYKHEIALAVEIAGMLAGGPFGLAIAGVAAFADAKMYWDDGDRYMATLMAVLSLLPGTKLGFKLIKGTRLGRKAIIALAKKIKQIKAGAKPILTKIEQLYIRALGQPGIGSELSELIKRAAKTKAAKVAGKGAKAVATGTGRLAKAATGVAAPLYVTDKIYQGMGWEEADIEQQVNSDAIFAELK